MDVATSCSAHVLSVSGEGGQKASMRICCAVFPKSVGYVCQAVQVKVFKFFAIVAGVKNHMESSFEY